MALLADIVKAGVTLQSLFHSALIDSLELRILIEQATGFSRVQQIAHSDHQLKANEAEKLRALIQRRIAGEPIAYIVGEREFYGLSFQVSPQVLIPRPETELLVEIALERIPANGSVVDLGTGSGAIAVSLAYERPDISVTATDVSEGALAMARGNAGRILGKRTQPRFLAGDWYAALDNPVRYDVIVSNPPYIHRDDNHLSQGDLRFEPQNALTDFADGLSAYATIINGAHQFLKPNGWLLMEHGYNQAKNVQDMLGKKGFASIMTWNDFAGIARVTGGVCPPCSAY